MILQMIAPIIQQIEIIYFFIIPTLLELVIANSFSFILTDLKIFFYSNCSLNSYKIFFRGFFTQVSSSGFLSAALPYGHTHHFFLPDPLVILLLPRCHQKGQRSYLLRLRYASCGRCLYQGFILHIQGSSSFI